MTPPGEGLPGLAVRRPMMAAVLNLLIVIAGLAAILGVEVRELPDVDRPIVSVRASPQVLRLKQSMQKSRASLKVR